MTIRELIKDLMEYDLDGEVSFKNGDNNEFLYFDESYPEMTDVRDWTGNTILKTVNGCEIRFTHYEI